MNQKKTLQFAKTFATHFLILTLISCLFRIYFAWNFGWLSWDILKSAILFGLRFDFAMAGALSFLFTLIVFISSRAVLFSIPYILLMVCLIADLLYFQEANRHLSYEIWDFFTSLGELGTYLVNYWFYFSAAATVVFILSMYLKKISFWTDQFNLKSVVAQIFVCIFITLISIRGGLTGIPQNPALAYKAGGHTEAQIALNGAYAIFYSFVSGRYLKPEPIVFPENLNPKDYAQKVYEGEQAQKPVPQKYNIIIIFLEGWAAEYSQSYGYSQNVTPVFDSIRKKSITTAVTLAGGKRTTEGMFSSLCSYQNPLGKAIMFNHLENQKYACLPQILKERGWYTAYLQGTNNMTSGVGAFTYKTGFIMTGGKKEYPQYDTVEKNSWGLFDSDLYGWVFDEMKKAPEPFLFSIGTNTTHDLNLRKGESYVFGNKTVQEKNRSVLHSADKDLGDFINKVESQNWEHPVLYVLVSDHTSHVTSSNYNGFRLPFAIYSKNLQAQYFDFAISQRDIAPTILDLLGIEESRMTGVSLFSKTQRRFAEYYNSQRLGVIVDEDFVEWNIKNLEDKKCYHWRIDFELKKPIPCTDKAVENGLIGLGFTKYSQELLFSNKALDFRKDVQSEP